MLFEGGPIYAIVGTTEAVKNSTTLYLDHTTLQGFTAFRLSSAGGRQFKEFTVEQACQSTSVHQQEHLFA